MRWLRLVKILRVALKYGLDEFLLGHERFRWLRPTARAVTFWRDLSAPRAQRLRLALQELGPIFVKFGQMLSTRRDLLPTDIADELAGLQDRVPPFPSEQVIATLQRVYGKPVEDVFRTFDRTPVASASVAQVHLATLPDGTPAAVKVLRPNIANTIEKDLALMQAGALMVEKLWSDGKRLKPREVVAEFDRTIHDELDLMREAASCSQLRRNFLHSPLRLVPEVFWDWCNSEVMVMEQMEGTPIGQVERLVAQGIDVRELARIGVEIFFTQVFRDGFFHADMHPGNIFVATDAIDKGKYIALDFGIMGTLSDTDKNYLAQNFLAFFRRDYRRVATAHIESGWVPADTRVDELESEIRAVCEPIFDRPLKEISLAKVLVQLFRASRRFNVEIQPQLVLLQKTLLNVEGLGRQLDPDLDLWVTAMPFLERWMEDQIGFRALERRLRDEAPFLMTTLPPVTQPVAYPLVGAAGRGRPRAERVCRGTARAEPLAGGGGGTAGRSDCAVADAAALGVVALAASSFFYHPAIIKPPVPSAMARLEIQNVSRRFGDFTAVDQVSIDIEAGEFFTLLGPSGCGKTTLLRMIAGFDLPDGGCILLNGEDLADRPPEERPVRTVFQSYALFPHMTVEGNIAFPLQMARTPAAEVPAKVQAALEDVRLVGFGKRYPHELSGGQKQRVAIGRALVTHPTVLLLAEPLAALDAKLREEMQIELINLQKEVGITFVYVTHDQTEALALSHRIAVMNKGRVEQIGEPSKIYNFPATRFVADFIGTCNLLEGPVSARDGDTITIDAKGLGPVRVVTGAGMAAGSNGTIALRPEKIRISASTPNAAPNADAAGKSGGTDAVTDNHFRGTVTDHLYLGDVTVYIVSTALGCKLETLLANSDAGRTKFFEVGDAG